jgi:hypothetical protein
MAWCAPSRGWRGTAALGDAVEVIGPDRFRNFPMPGYAEIRLAFRPRAAPARMLVEARPDAMHIATEGPLGMGDARAICAERGWRFTTSFHTRFAGICPGAHRHPAAPGPGRCCAASTMPARAPSPPRRCCGEELARARLSPCAALVAAAWISALFQDGRARARMGRRCRGRSSSMSGASRSRRISRPSSRSTCPAARWWWAMGRSARRSRRRYPDAHFAGWRHGEGLARAYRGGGCDGVPLAHRHLRPGAGGGDGLRHAGRGLSGDGAARCGGARAVACWTGSARAPAWPRWMCRVPPPAPMPSASPGRPAPAPSGQHLVTI